MRCLSILSILILCSFYANGQYTPLVNTETRGINWPNSAADNCAGTNPLICPTYNVTGMNWYMSGVASTPFSFVFSTLPDISNRDYAMVNGGVIEVRDPNGGICFNSSVINISGLGTISMSFQVTRPGAGTTYNFVNFNYRVNGGPWVSSGNLTGGSGVTSNWNPTASGNTLELMACMACTGNNDVYNLTQMNTNLGGPLPVKWSGFFLAPTEKGHSQVSWQTASEINNDYFEVERSMDGINYISVGQVKGSGNTSSPSNYEFIDETTKPGNTYYYRIRQVDFDGKQDYSIVLSITLKGLYLGIKASPNPADDFINIELDQPLDNDLHLELFRLDGKIIKTISISEGEYSKSLDLSDLPIGIYLLKSKGSTLIHQKILKTQN